MKTLKKQGGFTLVEIAIVLVIVGLLLAGVLKGQELIENSKIKNIAKDADAISAGILSYRDRYKGFPGDETINTANIYGWAANVGGGGGDGLVGVTGASPFAGNAETTNAFRALRFAGFIGGDPVRAGAAARPPHAGGGTIALGNGVYGLIGNVVCLNNLSGKFAGAIDRLIDDGVSSTGVVRSDTAVPLAAVATVTNVTYQENTAAVFLCKTL